MIPDGEYTAIVDRIEDGLATIILEVDDEDAFELTVDPEELPPDGRHSDAILDVVVSDGSLIEAVCDEEETEQRKQTAQRRFDRLSDRLPDDSSSDDS